MAIATEAFLAAVAADAFLRAAAVEAFLAAAVAEAFLAAAVVEAFLAAAGAEVWTEDFLMRERVEGKASGGLSSIVGDKAFDLEAETFALEA